jgi:hypothetical protein
LGYGGLNDSGLGRSNMSINTLRPEIIIVEILADANLITQ